MLNIQEIKETINIICNSKEEEWVKPYPTRELFENNKLTCKLLVENNSVGVIYKDKCFQLGFYMLQHLECDKILDFIQVLHADNDDWDV